MDEWRKNKIRLFKKRPCYLPGCDMKKIQELKLANLTVLSDHRVLNQVARDLVAGLQENDLPKRSITIFVGLHRRFGFNLIRSGTKIALQTEHYFDADGRKMWRRAKRSREIINILFCDYVLDLSPCNREHYAKLPNFLRKKIIFGPHIFPSVKPKFSPGNNGIFIFFGEMNDRRKSLISAQPPGRVKSLSSPTFGDDLSREINDAAGILNLHYAEGRYTEIPRLLAACLSGKVVMSEVLDNTLVPNRDYLLLGNYSTETEANDVYDNFWENFAKQYSLAKFLNAKIHARDL